MVSSTTVLRETARKALFPKPGAACSGDMKLSTRAWGARTLPVDSIVSGGIKKGTGAVRNYLQVNRLREQTSLLVITVDSIIPYHMALSFAYQYILGHPLLMEGRRSILPALSSLPRLVVARCHIGGEVAQQADRALAMEVDLRKGDVHRGTQEDVITFKRASRRTIPEVRRNPTRRTFDHLA